MRRIVTIALVVALALIALAGGEDADAASVTLSSGQIQISFTATGSTAETLYVYRSGSNWTFSGDLDGGSPSTIPTASSCNFLVSAAGNSTDQVLVFGPSGIVSPDCSYGPFKFRTVQGGGLDRLELSGDVNVPQGGGFLDINTATTLVADFAVQLYTTDSVDFNATLNGAHGLAATAGTVSLPSRVGGVTPLTSLTTTATTNTVIGSSVTTTGSQTYTGPVKISAASPITLAAGTLTLGGSLDPIVNDYGTATLTADVASTSTIGGVLGSTSGTATQKSIALVKEGAGTLSLPASNTYTGSTTVSGGTLISSNAYGLGDSTAGTTVGNGARLEFRLGANNVEPITLAGGATLAATTTGVEALGGPITLQSGSQTFDVGTGAVLHFSGGVDGQSAGRGAVTATGTGSVSIGALGVGATNAIASFASSATGGLRIGGDIRAAGTVTMDGAVETRSSPVTVTGAPVSGSGSIDNGAGSSGSTLTIDSGSEPNTLSGAIGSGAGDAAKVSLVLAGIGQHTVSGTSGFTGSLVVQAGALIVSGTLTHPSSTTIASGASVAGSGTGTIGSPVSLASGSPGFGVGAGYPYRLNVGALTSSTLTGHLNVVVDGTTPGTGYTQIASTGGATLTGLSVWSDGFEAPIGTVITPVTTASGITGTLAGYPEGSYYSYWRISYAANGGRDLTWTFEGLAPSPTSVSPSTSSLSGGGTLTVTGGPLYDGTQVTVGGAACTNASLTVSGDITCTLPAHAAGAADVVVTNGARSATLAGAVIYAPPAEPAVSSASASGGGSTARALAIGTPRLVGAKLVTTIATPGPGAILQTAVTRKGRKATTRCTVRRTVAASADLTITCALDKRTRTALRKATLRLTVTTTFTPTGGAPTKQVAKVKAKRIAKGKRSLGL